MSNIHPLIFIVEDDKAFAIMIKKYLFVKGIRNIEIYNSGEECLENISKNPKIIIQDYDLTGMNGMEVLKKVKQTNKEIQFIFLSGQHSLKTAVEIMKNGASDYVVKDEIAKDYVLHKIRNIIHIIRLEHKQKTDRYVKFIFIITLLVSWVGLIWLYFIRNG